MPSLRQATVYRHGTGLVVVLPVDWTRGMGIEAGDKVTLRYNGSVEISKVEEGVRE